MSRTSPRSCSDVSLGRQSLTTTYQASTANGDDASVKPTVAGRVPCSKAYAEPVLLKAVAILIASSPSLSTFGLLFGSPVLQKFTMLIQYTQILCLQSKVAHDALLCHVSFAHSKTYSRELPLQPSYCVARIRLTKLPISPPWAAYPPPKPKPHINLFRILAVSS